MIPLKSSNGRASGGGNGSFDEDDDEEDEEESDVEGGKEDREEGDAEGKEDEGSLSRMGRYFLSHALELIMTSEEEQPGREKRTAKGKTRRGVCCLCCLLFVVFLAFFFFTFSPRKATKVIKGKVYEKEDGGKEKTRERGKKQKGGRICRPRTLDAPLEPNNYKGYRPPKH